MIYPLVEKKMCDVPLEVKCTTKAFDNVLTDLIVYFLISAKCKQQYTSM
jgi:hypothetical protein